MTRQIPHGIPSLYINPHNVSENEGYWPVTGTLLIGREQADITVALPAVSRRHAEVVVTPHAVCTIQDLGSKNGTSVNGKLLGNSPVRLSHGDTVTLGGVAELLFNDPLATPVAPRLGSLSGLWIDPISHDVWIDAKKLNPPLSPRQLALLQLIVTGHGKIVSKDEIIYSLWPEETAQSISNDAVDSLIKRLRRRLSSIEQENPVLEVVRGRGIRLNTCRPKQC